MTRPTFQLSSLHGRCPASHVSPACLLVHIGFVSVRICLYVRPTKRGDLPGHGLRVANAFLGATLHLLPLCKLPHGRARHVAHRRIVPGSVASGFDKRSSLL